MGLGFYEDDSYELRLLAKGRYTVYTWLMLGQHRRPMVTSFGFRYIHYILYLYIMNPLGLLCGSYAAAEPKVSLLGFGLKCPTTQELYTSSRLVAQLLVQKSQVANH